MKNDIQVHQSTLFRRAYKRLHPNDKADVDDAIAHQCSPMLNRKDVKEPAKKINPLTNTLQRPVKGMEKDDE
ncbi:MAG: hypothetical protein WCG61_06340 [Chlorobium sp.]